MGTLTGHLVPGTIFITIGLWWSFITTIRFLLSKRKSPFRNNVPIGYRGSVEMPCIFLPFASLRHGPVESWTKLILITIGIVGEAITGYKTTSSGTAINSWHFEYGNAQHITVYFIFAFGALIEILTHHRCNLPSRTSYVFTGIAFAIEAFIFANHLHGRSALDTHLHTLFVYAIYGCFITTLLEALQPQQILFTYGRILFTILQGTWFWEVGLILYPPVGPRNWEDNNHHELMLLTIFYCWHIIFILIGLIAQISMVGFMVKYFRYFEKSCDELISIDNIENAWCFSEEDKGSKFFRLLTQDDEDSCVRA